MKLQDIMVTLTITTKDLETSMRRTGRRLGTFYEVGIEGSRASQIYQMIQQVKIIRHNYLECVLFYGLPLARVWKFRTYEQIREKGVPLDRAMRIAKWEVLRWDILQRQMIREGSRELSERIEAITGRPSRSYVYRPITTVEHLVYRIERDRKKMRKAAKRGILFGILAYVFLFIFWHLLRG